MCHQSVSNVSSLFLCDDRKEQVAAVAINDQEAEREATGEEEEEHVAPTFEPIDKLQDFGINASDITKLKGAVRANRHVPNNLYLLHC
jgi:hypothetical protein